MKTYTIALVCNSALALVPIAADSAESAESQALEMSDESIAQFIYYIDSRQIEETIDGSVAISTFPTDIAPGVERIGAADIFPLDTDERQPSPESLATRSHQMGGDAPAAGIDP